MLPNDPQLQGRLLRSARLLLDWSQARLACEIGSSRATVHAVESGRLDRACPAALAMAAALERAGVEFIPANSRHGPGLRYTPPG
jgi:DNA-binding XRE family transcriptional regulator